MRRVGWAGLHLGTAVALLTGGFILWVLPDFYAMISCEEGPRGGNVLSAERQVRADALSALAAAAPWTLAYFMGGSVAGGMARLSPRSNGAPVAVCGALRGGANVVVLAVGPAALTDPENGAQIFAGFVVSGIFFPITVLVSYLGGKAAARPRAGTLGERGNGGRR